MVGSEVCEMSKRTVVRTWLGGVIVLAGGLVVMGVSIALMLAFGGTFTPAENPVPTTGQAYDFVPTLDGFFWSTVVGIVFGCILAAIGGLIQLVAWVGAMANTFRLADKAWFAVLLVGGILGFMVGLAGLAVMLAYVIAGPDGLAVESKPAPMAGALAPTA
jgi:hypothetical protein